MALFSAEKRTSDLDEAPFSADKYEEKSDASKVAADNLESKAKEFAEEIPGKWNTDPLFSQKVYNSKKRLEWIRKNVLPRLNTNYMKLEERKRVSTIWMCGILFRKHVVPRIITEVGKIDKSELRTHSTDARRSWVSDKNKEWNIAYRDRKKTVWNSENLKEEDWGIFDTAFPGELGAIKAYTTNTGLSGWLLKNWFMAFVMYELFLIVPTKCRPKRAKSELKELKVVAGASVPQPHDAGAGLLKLKETQKTRRTTRRTKNLRLAWKEIANFQISAGVFRLVERKFTAIEALFYAIAKWHKSEYPKASWQMTTDYGKSARINLLDFCQHISDSVLSEKQRVIKLIRSIFDTLAKDEKTENLEEDKFEAALNKIIEKGVSYIDDFRNKDKDNSIGETNRAYLHRVITQKVTDFLFHDVILPRYEIFMNDAEYDDASCWLWKQFEQVEKSNFTSGLKSMVPTHLRNMPLYQDWTMNFIVDKSGSVFKWQGENKRLLARTNSFRRNIVMDITYLHNGNALKILQTVAHEFGHAMSMYGRHALQALFQPWARYFGETNPREYDDRNWWHTEYSELPCPDTGVRDKKYEDKWTAEEMRKLQIKTLYSPMLELKLPIKTLRI